MVGGDACEEVEGGCVDDSSLEGGVTGVEVGGGI